MKSQIILNEKKEIICSSTKKDLNFVKIYMNVSWISEDEFQYLPTYQSDTSLFWFF